MATIDLRDADMNVSALYGHKAVFTTYDGERLVGVLAENPREFLPRIVFEDGQWGRAGDVIELV